MNGRVTVPSLVARQTKGSGTHSKVTEEGIPNDHPFFTILEADEAARSSEQGRNRAPLRLL